VHSSKEVEQAFQSKLIFSAHKVGAGEEKENVAIGTSWKR